MRRFLLSILFCVPTLLWADFPEATNRMVNDFAGVFTGLQVREMETRLEAFSDSTSNQICVVTISDLEDYEPADYAQRLGQKWGVGSAKDNGVLILLKLRRSRGGRFGYRARDAGRVQRRDGLWRRGP